MKFGKYFLLLAVIILAGWVGYKFGTVEARLRFYNWKPSVVINKSPLTQLSSNPQEVDFSLFWTVWDKVNKTYVDKSKLDSKKMVDGAIAGMVAAIGDPYTSYLPVEQNKASKEDLGGAFDGVGIQLGYQDQRLAVMSPLEGSPAKAAGVQAGDYIIHIKDTVANVDRDTDGLSIPEAVKLIRGKKGTSVELTLVRPQVQKPISVSLVRDTIVVKSVSG